VLVSSGISLPNRALTKMSQSRILRRLLGRPYLLMSVWIWNRLPASLGSWRLVRAYGGHLHRLIQWRSFRSQSVGTFFFRNRPELEMLCRLLARRPVGSALDLAVIGCSKGAEVYSISYAIRSARTDVKLSLTALDLSKEILEFAEAATYSFGGDGGATASTSGGIDVGRQVAANTYRDQPSSIFERMSPEEKVALFERERDQVRVKRQFRDGIAWRLGDAGDPGLVGAIGLQDIVVANRFLCHMYPEDAKACLRNIARLVKPGGYLFVSGVDLDVRSTVAKELGWKPVTELIREIHEGDTSLRHDWPLQYWGLEPFDQNRADRALRYAAIYRHDERS
jgi:chemotaxis methyl-accepting protein methylase